MDKYIIERMFGEKKKADMSSWEATVNKLLNPQREITIALVGKYTQLDDSYLSVLESLKHAGAFYDTKIKIERVDSENYESDFWSDSFRNLINQKNILAVVIPC
ncbi:MAG: CTP synthase [candidate division CPR1 bacterium ADurb.Bin160]|uniref:CTP synthase n=1 Tax=candidate division CPR1 bacterium ADurb.Bin160 TaxID=1852826 RepID=A0A1V5ZQY2_9BACT|nr:MAG: CTP synthase [candidate division CPR1 bacterium ADurb.Bin160]